MKCIYEEFSSIDNLLTTLAERPNNEIMRSENSSNSGSADFCKTKDYAEATSLLQNGYTDHLEEIRELVRKNNALIFQQNSFRKKPQTMPVGYIPHVPNALQNKPDSMINVVSNPAKRKTISIIYCIGGSCGEATDTFIKAGAALVSAINLTELAGIQTKLMVGFMPAKEGGGLFSFGDNPKEMISPVLRIKNWGERFNLTKICFPLIHPSMFRRIGFKYLETCPELTESGFAHGYGSVPSLDELKQNVPHDAQTYILNTKFIKDKKYEVDEILRYLEVIK